MMHNTPIRTGVVLFLGLFFSTVVSGKEHVTLPEAFAGYGRPAPQPPTVEIRPVIDKKHNWARIKGEVTDMGDVDAAEVVIRYRRTGEEEWRETSPRIIERWNIPEAFPGYLTGLSPETTYEYMALARPVDQNDDTLKGISASHTLTTPAPAPPKVITQGVALKTPEWAQAEGRVLDTGGGSSVNGFIKYRREGEEQWMESPPFTISRREAPRNFYGYLRNLQPGAIYQYRAVVYWQFGQEKIVSEDVIKRFRTPSP